MQRTAGGAGYAIHWLTRLSKNGAEDLTNLPVELGSWRHLGVDERLRWLEVARDRHHRGTREATPDAPPGSCFTIDGADLTELAAFFCALGEAVNGPGGYFGLSDLALQDCLYGGYGVTLPFTLRILNSRAAAANLNSWALAAWARGQLDAEDYLDEEGERYLTEAIIAGDDGSRTLLDEIAALLTAHGVTVEQL